jgi:hypothetical protein
VLWLCSGSLVMMLWRHSLGHLWSSVLRCSLRLPLSPHSHIIHTCSVLSTHTWRLYSPIFFSPVAGLMWWTLCPSCSEREQWVNTYLAPLSSCLIYLAVWLLPTLMYWPAGTMIESTWAGELWTLKNEDRSVVCIGYVNTGDVYCAQINDLKLEASVTMWTD